MTNIFKEILDESRCKSNKILVDKCSEFFDRLTKSRLPHNDIEMHSTHNEGKSLVAEKCITTLKKFRNI